MSAYIVASLAAFTDFRAKSIWIALQAGFDGPLPLFFIPKIVRAIIAVAHVTELSVRETVAISARKYTHGLPISLNKTFSKCLLISDAIER